MKNYKAFKQNNIKVNSFSENVCKRFTPKKEKQKKRDENKNRDVCDNTPRDNTTNESDSESDQNDENSDVGNRMCGSYAIAAMCEVCSCHDKQKNEKEKEKEMTRLENKHYVGIQKHILSVDTFCTPFTDSCYCMISCLLRSMAQ